MQNLDKHKVVFCIVFCLQDSPFTNAGTGSNLNLVGDIECDASIMEGKSLDYGAVGALSGGLINVVCLFVFLLVFFFVSAYSSTYSEIRSAWVF